MKIFYTQNKIRKYVKIKIDQFKYISLMIYFESLILALTYLVKGCSSPGS